MKIAPLAFPTDRPKSAGFIERFLDAADAHPGAVAVEDQDAALLTYAGLLGEMEQWRAAFEALGVSRGDAVVLLLPSGEPLISAFYALASLGAIATPLSPYLTPFELAPALTDGQPTGVVAPSSVFTGALGATLAGCAALRFAVATDAMPTVARLGEARVVGRAELPTRGSPLAPPAGDPVVSCHFTYKGVGRPLGALHRYRDYSAVLEGIIARYPQEPGALHLLALPLWPVYGLTVAVMGPLAVGCRIVLPAPGHEARLLDVLCERRVRHATLIPRLIRTLVQRARGRGPSGLDPAFELTSGGSFLSRELAEEAAVALGVEPLQGYGLTETLPVTGNWPGVNRRGSLGRPLAESIGVRVVDADGNDVPPFRGGEIVVYGPTVAQAFVSRPSETERFLADGECRTGDLGWLDDEGFLWFLGRRLPITKVIAQMVDLTEVEAVLRAHPGVADARATVRSDGVRGEVLEASVMMHGQATAARGSLLDHCRKRLSRHKVPRHFRVFERRRVSAEGEP